MQQHLKILSARAVKSAVGTLAEQFRRETGTTVAFDFAPVGALEQKLAAGESADVVILSVEAIDRLEKCGRIDAESRRLLGRTSIGVAVRDGAPLPDIATPDAFRALLLSADRIAVSDVAVGGTSAKYLPQLFERMGITAMLEPKLVRCTSGGDVTERVARGEAAIGMTFVSEMLAIAGATVVGPLPAPYGNDTTYCAASMNPTRVADAASAFIAALVGTHARDIWRTTGFESL